MSENCSWRNTFLVKTFVRLADKNLALARKYGKVAVTAVGMFSKEPWWFIPHGGATVLLTVGSISPKVIEEKGQFISKEHLCLTAIFDHDIVDGAPAARFMSRLRQVIKKGGNGKEMSSLRNDISLQKCNNSLFFLQQLLVSL
jgi:hypothetical protein